MTASLSPLSPLSLRQRLEEIVFIKFPYWCTGVLFLIAAAINIVNVVARYAFSAPVYWAEEAIVFIVIWSVFLVAGSITYRGANLNMDLLYSSLFSPLMKTFVNVAIVISLIACSLFTAYQSWRVVQLQYLNQGVTAGTNIPLFIPHAALLFGFSFIALAGIARFSSYVTGKFND